MEEKINLILKYFVIQRIKENIVFQMQVEMSERRYDKESPPKLAPVYESVSAEEGELLKQMAELTNFDFAEIDKEVKENVPSDSSVQESQQSESGIIIP